ncbi:succinyl-diaminopimelate desuccinylase [Falsarthrobacter nasiphocae]|uniref:Succinyl-diaminopimelate desuccinylase n=1 Tax=Falsarthrobacter nasiphocae TaxID=189863 RepID=A0AAE4C5W0_9MICC|nr:succinyl-diaminopimelate desuccinylase [Falsarthrobacter nasiphocae]MDR6891487.1 succinyl-diaminopimelate desuccinylase [Falsarthrobacter nasiphocae]
MSHADIRSPQPLDLSGDVADLTRALMDIESVSGGEGPLADAVWEALSGLDGLELARNGDTILARTSLGRAERVMLAGHLDTVPLPTTPGARGTVPAAVEDGVIYGRGATDMKGGVAVQLAVAGMIGRGELNPNRDVTFVFYDHEEVSADLSGFGRLVESHGELLGADFGILLEPTNGVVEGGCNGTIRLEARTTGTAAHSARAWMGENAIHRGARVLTRLAEHEPQTVRVEGLDYRESLNAVRIAGGTAGNVIPDSMTIEINYRFAPSKSPAEAEEYVRGVLGDAIGEGCELVVTDAAAGARPGLTHPAAASFVEAVGGEPLPKYGWTDVARLSALGIPAVNFGPGDALLAHTDDEHVAEDAVRRCLEAMTAWLS